MSKRKLLLADDSITIQKVVNLTFADEGIEVIPVGDGDSAMRKFDEFMPDLVMADVNMPGLTGYEICRIIKQTEETRHIPVILLVGSFEPFDEEEAKNVGADDFLTKPFQSIRQLVNKVTELLNQKESVAEESPDEAQIAPPTDTFADTLEFEKKDEESVTEFGDAGMDDEMIETSPANDFVSESEPSEQAESTIDYAKTQPLNAEDLKGFNIVPVGDVAEEETQETTENQELAEETAEVKPERAEPATFEEEARQFEETIPYGEYIPEEEAEEELEEEPQNISESEPQIDYYLPTEKEEFEKELTDAETLEPEVSYSSEEPRTAYFSEATVEEADETESAIEESTETEETDEIEESEETSSETETSFVEEPQTEEPVEETIEESETEEKVEESETETPEESEDDLTEEAETEESPTSEAVAETQVSTSENLHALNFDDGDLLELPPLVEETGIRPQTQVQQLKSEPESEAVAETVAETEPETAETQTAAEAEYETIQSFPPELIEAIAQRVAEKISAKTMNDVLPQITDLVMKKLAEEKKE